MEELFGHPGYKRFVLQDHKRLPARFFARVAGALTGRLRLSGRRSRFSVAACAVSLSTTSARKRNRQMTAPRTLYDKIWDDHLVDRQDDGTCLLYIDRHLVHEVTSPQAFEGCA